MNEEPQDTAEGIAATLRNLDALVSKAEARAAAAELALRKWQRAEVWLLTLAFVFGMFLGGLFGGK